MDCQFCQNSEISKSKVGQPFSPQQLADALKNLVDEGVHNINFVTPTHFSHRIVETLCIYRPPVPIVYNTSGYELPEVIENLFPYVDIFLTDFKYADDRLAKKYSRREKYLEYCLASTAKMVEDKPPLYDENGLLRQGVIVRHLMLPTEIQNTLEVIDIFSDRWKDRAIFSLMSQFFPAYKSQIKRTLKPVEYKIACSRLLERGVENCFVQELSSANESYVPLFDLR
ncbi:MAG: radical SAM protein [Clostridia bacterium]|nr:radical SAM protein [Clostridia bacterium]